MTAQEGDSVYSPFLDRDPTDFWDVVDSGRRWSMQPELRLMQAVLFDVVERALKLRHVNTERATAMREDILAWLGSDGWLFSFQSCCEHLGYDPGWLEEKLRAVVGGREMPAMELPDLRLVGRAAAASKKLTGEQRQEIILRSRRGESIRSLAKEYDVSAQYVSALRARGLRGGAR